MQELFADLNQQIKENIIKDYIQIINMNLLSYISPNKGKKFFL